MKILIIDTSTSFLYCFLYNLETNNNLYEKIMLCHNNHSENLVEVIKEALDYTKIKITDISKIIVGIGPGSYTGLKIACVVSKMASLFSKIPLYTISSLRLLGSKYFKEDGLYAIRSAANKENCYALFLKVSDKKIEIIKEDSFLSNVEFEKLSQNYFIINEKNYLLDSFFINNNSLEEKDIHNLVPNYLRNS